MKIVPIHQTGFGRSAQEIWEIHSEHELSDDEIRAAIERHKPSAGYGESYWNRIKKLENEPFRVNVKSWASAD